MNAARSAKPCATPELRARQLQSVAQHPEQRSVGRNIYCFLVAVYVQSESCQWRDLEAGNILAQTKKNENGGPADSSDSVERPLPIEYAADLTPFVALKESGARWNAIRMAES